MQTVFESADYAEVMVKRSVLEAAGMHVLMSDFHSAGAIPHVTNDTGYRLQVVEEDVKQALMLLHPEIEPEDLVPASEAKPAPMKQERGLIQALMPFILVKGGILMAVAIYFLFIF